MATTRKRRFANMADAEATVDRERREKELYRHAFWVLTRQNYAFIGSTPDGQYRLYTSAPNKAGCGVVFWVFKSLLCPHQAESWTPVYWEDFEKWSYAGAGCDAELELWRAGQRVVRALQWWNDESGEIHPNGRS